MWPVAASVIAARSADVGSLRAVSSAYSQNR